MQRLDQAPGTQGVNDSDRLDAFDFAIVGAGIAGASLAYRLAPHAKVVMLEQEPQPGLHATGRSAAMYIETYGPPAVRALTRASRAFYERPPAGFAEQALVAPRGCLHVAMDGQQALLERAWQAMAEAVPGARRLGRDEALARVPVLRADVVIGAIEEPDAQDMDVDALHQGFLRGARRAGCALRTGAALARGVRDAAGWTLQISDGGRVRCAVVVDAAGAWADELARACGVAPVGLVPRRRSAFIFAPPAGVDASGWPAVIGIDESFYFKPDAGRLLGSPANADDTHAHDVMPEELDVAIGIDRIETFTTMTIRRPIRTWAGLRSFVRDGEPVIGFAANEPAFFWLAGQGGYGIQTAAAASELAATMLLGQALPAWAQDDALVSALAPTRLGG